MLPTVIFHDRNLSDFSDSIASGVEGFGADFFLRTAEEIFITLVPHGRVESPHGVDTL